MTSPSHTAPAIWLPVVTQQPFEIDIMRWLGRVEFSTTRHLYTLFGATYHQRAFAKRIKQLADSHLIWRQSIAIRPADRTQGLRLPDLIGLTPEGKAHLASLGIEPTKTLEYFRTRDRRAPKVRPESYRHDLAVTNWIWHTIQPFYHHPKCTAIDIRVEVNTHETQRIDAIVRICLDPLQRDRNPSGFPFWDGGGSARDVTWFVFGLEMDMGTEKLSILMEKAIVYKNLSESGHYERMFQAPLIPVILVHAPDSPRRLRQIAAEWLRPEAWPTTPALGSITRWLTHPEDVFRGYRMLRNPKEPVGIIPASFWDAVATFNHEQYQNETDPRKRIPLPRFDQKRMSG